MLQSLQKQRIITFLKSQDTNPWSVLVLDKTTEAILAPIIKTNDLRDCSITSHYLIENKRQKIRDTPAVYFIDSTARNIEIIKKDIEKEIYATFYLNFVNSISRSLLESLAEYASQFGRGLHIRSVIDQFCDFVALQNNLFTMNRTNTYLNEVSVDEVVNSLFGVFATLNECPVIVDTSGVATEIANKLVKKIRNTKLVKESRKKAVLIFIDRSFDIKSPLEHVWTYAALIDDLLEMKLNKVKLSKTEKVEEDFEVADDFWAKHSDEYFPVVAEQVEHELTDYKKEMALRSLDEKSDKKKIEEALEKAPLLAKKKQSMHVHVTISMALVEKIKSRCIDEFYRIEKNTFKNSELIDIAEKGNDNDILRLGVSILGKDNRHVVEGLFKQRKINLKFLSLFDTQEVILPQGTAYGKVVSGLLGSVKKLLPVGNESILSKKVEQFYNKIKNGATEDLSIFYPFGSRIYEREISRLVVFINGGTTYTELKSINELARKLNVEILLGSTEIINADGFIQQLKKKEKL